MDNCIDRLMLIVGSFSRKMCGFNVGEPRKSTNVFCIETLSRLRDKELTYNAIFENNYVTVEQVCINLYLDIL